MCDVHTFYYLDKDMYTLFAECEGIVFRGGEQCEWSRHCQGHGLAQERLRWIQEESAPDKRPKGFWENWRCKYYYGFIIKYISWKIVKWMTWYFPVYGSGLRLSARYYFQCCSAVTVFKSLILTFNVFFAISTYHFLRELLKLVETS